MSTTSDRSHAADGRLKTSFLALVYANAFITGAVVMGFEMLGSRYLNPFFGSGIYTWAALISTVLAALTAGYFFGGWMADRNPKPSGLGWLIVGGSVYLAVIPLFADGLLDALTAMLGGLSDQREFERWGSIAGAMLLLFVPLALLGVYSPYAIRLTLRATARSGTVAGRIYGISTLGSIFGTLFVTFYLIPTMGSRTITFLLAAIGLAAGLSFLIVRPAGARRALPALAAAALLGVLAAPQPAQAQAEMGERFVAYLKKEGNEVRHGAIEALARGFRIKDVVLVGRDKVELKAAAFEAAAFEERAGGEATLSGVVMTDIALAGPDKTTATVVRIAAASIDWAPGPRLAFKEMMARDIAVTTPKDEQVRMATLSSALFRVEAGTGGALERLAIRGITSKSKDESGSVGSVDVESVLIDLPRRASIKGAALRDIAADTKDGTIRIASMELRAFEAVNFYQGSPNPADIRALEFAIKGIEAPISSAKDPGFAHELQALGYTKLTIGGELSYRYEEANKIYNLAKLELDVADAATLTLAFKIGGITPDEIRRALQPPPPPPPGQTPPPERGSRDGIAAMGILARMNLVSADLSFRDKSLIGRIVKREAQKQQTDEASIKAQYRALLTALRDEQTDPLAKEVYDVLIAFLEDPGELVVEVRPPAPLNFLAIGALAAASPAQLRTVLGIKATARKK